MISHPPSHNQGVKMDKPKQITMSMANELHEGLLRGIISQGMPKVQGQEFIVRIEAHPTLPS